MMDLELEIPARWVLFVYLTLEVLKFVYDRFISQQEYIRILRDIAASQHATAQILEKLAETLHIENKKRVKKTKTKSIGAIVNVSKLPCAASNAQSGRPRKMNRFNIGSALDGGSQKRKHPEE